MAHPHAWYRAAVALGSMALLSCSPPPNGPKSAAQPGTAHSGATQSGAAQPNSSALSETAEGPPTSVAAASERPDAPPNTVPQNSYSQNPAEADVATGDLSSPRSAKIAEECSALCENAAPACSRRGARQCRANCGKYQSISDRCEVQVLGAIRCQAAVPKLICSNVTSECVQQFRELNACEQGALQKTSKVEAGITAPDGWERISDAASGFVIHLPKGASLGEHRGHRTWSAEAPGGARYLVSVLPALSEGASERSLTQALMRYLGHRCQPAVRLHGRFETERDVAERFDGRCADGNGWHGILRASRQNLILIAEVVPPGQEKVGDAFYYSFEKLP